MSSHEKDPGWITEISVDIDTRSIYHLLSRSFCQCVTISQVVDLYIPDVVAICNIHLTIDSACAVGVARAWRIGFSTGWTLNLYLSVSNVL
jgi:hypothetical protein